MTDLENKIAKEVCYQKQFYESLYLTYKNINRTFLLLFRCGYFYVIGIHVYYFLKV